MGGGGAGVVLAGVVADHGLSPREFVARILT